MSQPEARLQADILDLIRVAYPQAVVFSVPNGGELSR